MDVDGSDLTIIIPLYRRTKNMERVCASAHAATPAAQVVLVVSEGDHAVRDKTLGVDFDTLIVVDGAGGERGDYARKINAAYRATSRAFLFTGADDLIFHGDWYKQARAFGDFGVVGTVDQCNNRTVDGSHSTHSLVARWYADHGACIDEDHVIYHEGYWHEYCDDELVRTAMRRGQYAHAYGAIVEHVHMLRDRTLDDDVYRHGRSHTQISRALFRRRAALWGDTVRSGLRQAARPRVVRR